MPSIQKRPLAASLLLALGLVLSLPLLTGCGKSSSPTAPHVAAAQPESLAVTVTLSHILVVQDGDGIEGAGDFAFNIVVKESGGATRLNLDRSATIDAGDSHSLNRTLRFQMPSSRLLVVGITGTEWDRDILGRDYPDSRMNGVYVARNHRDGSPTADVRTYTGYLKVGSGELEARLYYTISAVPA